MACIIDSWVPTASITECAPSPSVSSLIAATPSSPRSVDDVGGAELARQRLPVGSCRLIAMIRSAPSCWAARTPSRPTAPSPTTATVLPGPASAATAANQPVPSTSEAASRLGSGRRRGHPGWRPGCRRPAGPAASSAWAPTGADGSRVDAGGLVAGPADLAGVVGGEERPDDELAGLDGASPSSPTSSTMPTYSCPIGVGPLERPRRRGRATGRSRRCRWRTAG